jgi:peptidylprolyl isomerase
VRARARRLALLAAVLALGGALTGLAGCHPAVVEPAGPESVEVSGEFGTVPTVTFPTPLLVEETSITTVIDGDGPEIAPGGPLLVDWIAFDGTTGEVTGETFATAPGVYAFTEDSLGEDLYDAVSASGANDRVLVLEPTAAAGVPGSRVSVIDVRPARAQGETVPPAPGLPAVTRAEDGAPSVRLPGGAPPAELVQQVLIKGAGEQVLQDSRLLVQYTAVAWSDGAVKATTWGEGKLPETLDLATAIPGLQLGLLDQTVGSQVLLVVPPGQAYGSDTMVFVVDLLAVVHGGGGGPTPTPSPTP